MEVAQRGGVVVERSGHLRVGRPEQRGPDDGRLAPERLGVSVLALPLVAIRQVLEDLSWSETPSTCPD